MKVKAGMRLSIVVESAAEANNSPVYPTNCTMNLYIPIPHHFYSFIHQTTNKPGRIMLCVWKIHTR